MAGPMVSRRRPRSEGEPFVGRAGELRVLGDALAGAAGGHGKLVLVTGESGIGKTTLVGQFLRQARRDDPALTLCRGRCVEQHGSGEAYLPFLDGLGTLLVGPERETVASLLRTYAPTWQPQLAAAGRAADVESRPGPTPGATRERMLREMGDVFESAAAATTMIGLLEDLQWADPSTLDLLRHLAERSPRQRLLLIVTYRSDDVDASPLLVSCRRRLLALGHARELSLDPFEPEDVRAYLDASFQPHTLPDDLAEHLHRRTEGHPLFLAKLVRFLVERGDVRSVDGRWVLTRTASEVDLQAPESVLAIARRKLESLDEDDRRALAYAAVMGPEFSSPVLASLLEADELDVEERLDRLDRRHRLIETLGEEEWPDGSLATRYRFVHSVYQELLYADLVSKKRILLHNRVAQELGRHHGRDSLVLAGHLAFHYERGRDFASAVKCRVLAGMHAMHLYAYSEAQEHLSRAEALVERLPSAERAAQTTITCERLGGLDMARGRFDRAVERYAAMLEAARNSGDRDAECRALIGSCDALFFGRRMAEMAVTAHEALCAAARAHSEARRAESLAAAALVLIEEDGNLSGSEALLEQGTELARHAGHRAALLRSLTYGGVVCYWRSDHAEAVRRLEEARQLAEEEHDAFLLLLCLMFLGYAECGQGRMSEAFRRMQEGLDAARSYGDRYWLPRLTSALAYVHREAWDLERAIELDRQALDLAGEGLETAAAGSHTNLAVDHMRAGRLEDAARELDAATEVVSGQDWLGWHERIRVRTARTELWLRLGDLETAARAAQELLESAHGHGALGYVVAAHVLAAEIAAAREDDGAVVGVHASAALEQLERRPVPMLAWRSHAARAKALGRAGNAQAARLEYGRAADVVLALARSLDDESARRGWLEAPPVREVLALGGRLGEPA